MSRVVISGVGIVGPHGVGAAPFFADGVTPASRFSPWPADVAQPHNEAVVAQVSDLPAKQFFTERQMRMMDRAMLLSSTAAGLALADAGLDAEAQRGACTFLGTARAELPSCYNFIRPQLGAQRDQLNAADFPKIARNIACGQVAIRYGMQGPSTVLASGALASIEAVIRAAQYIRMGRAQVALVGGYEALSRFSLYFYSHHYQQQLQALKPQFFGQAPGFLVPSEGACMLVIESAESAQARGATVYCDIDSWRSGRLGNDQEPAEALQATWNGLCGDTPVGLVCAASGGGNRPHEQTESTALTRWLAPGAGAKLVAPRAWIGEGEAWASALQVGLAAAMLRAGRAIGMPSVAPDAPAGLEELTHGGALQSPTALVSGIAAGGHFSNLHLTRRIDA